MLRPRLSAFLIAVALAMAAAVPAGAAGTAGEPGVPKSLLDDNSDSNSVIGPAEPSPPSGTMRLDLGTGNAAVSGFVVPLPGNPQAAPELPGQPARH
jgi:hypothetical protein